MCAWLRRIALAIAISATCHWLDVPQVHAADQSKAPISKNRFEDYPVEKYSGVFVLPTFEWEQKRFAKYRTRLANAAKEGINFGGHYNLAIVGCGIGCLQYYLIDGKTGLTADFIFSGEEYFGLDLTFRADSALVKASWEKQDLYNPVCNYADLVVQDSATGLLWRGQRAGFCE